MIRFKSLLKEKFKRAMKSLHTSPMFDMKVKLFVKCMNDGGGGGGMVSELVREARNKMISITKSILYSRFEHIINETFHSREKLF